MLQLEAASYKIESLSFCGQIITFQDFPGGQNGGPPQVPPFRIVAFSWGTAAEHAPPPLVDEVPKGQEGDLAKGHLQQVVDVAVCEQKARRTPIRTGEVTAIRAIREW